VETTIKTGTKLVPPLVSTIPKSDWSASSTGWDCSNSNLNWRNLLEQQFVKSKSGGDVAESASTVKAKVTRGYPTVTLGSTPKPLGISISKSGGSLGQLTIEVVVDVLVEVLVEVPVLDNVVVPGP